MNETTRKLIAELEEMFTLNYNNLEVVQKGIILLNTDLSHEVVETIEDSRDMLVHTFNLIRTLAVEMNKAKAEPKEEKQIRFNIFDSDFEEQLSRAESELKKEFGDFGQKRIMSFSPEDYPGGMDELMSMIKQQLDRDDEGGGNTYAFQ